MTAHGEGKTLPQRLLWIWGAFTKCGHVPCWVEGPCSSRTGRGSGLSQTLTEARAFPSASPELPAVVPLLPAKRGYRCHCQGPRPQQDTVPYKTFFEVTCSGLRIFCF